MSKPRDRIEREPRVVVRPVAATLYVVFFVMHDLLEPGFPCRSYDIIFVINDESKTRGRYVEDELVFDAFDCSLKVRPGRVEGEQKQLINECRYTD